MKHLILTAVLLMSATSYAGVATIGRPPEVTPLPPGTEALVSVAGSVTSVDPLCPKGAKCVTDGTVIQLLIPGQGCLDSLLPLTTEVLGDELVVHAQIAANPQSKVVRCASLPQYSRKLTLVNQYPTKVRFLGTGVVIIVD